MVAIVNINGRIVDGKDAVVSVFDHGFLYGEGVYEVLRTYRGEPFLLDRHLRRLRRSAQAIAIEPPLDDAAFEARIRDTIGALPVTTVTQPEYYVRIILTRGAGDFGYDPRTCPTPTLLVIAKPLEGPPAWYFERGVKVALVSIVRNHPETVNPRIKSNNLLNNALAMQEALRKGAVEGVMKNYRGDLAECSQSNLFIVKDGTVRTPPLEAGVLAGITREFLLEIAPEAGIRVEERTLREQDLVGADEAFITGTTFEVTPVVQVDDHVIGDGRPGPVARRLLQAYRQKAYELTAAVSR